MNYLYGILTNGIVTEGIPGFRYTDVTRTKGIHSLLGQIMGSVPEVVAAKADLIINLMRSSPSWVTFIQEFDPLNTYEEPVFPRYNVISNDFYDQLKQWVEKLNINDSKFQISNHDDFLQKAINSFYIIASTK